MKAVATLEAHRSTAWPSLKCPSGIHPKITAAIEARNPTTVAWTCTQFFLFIISLIQSHFVLWVNATEERATYPDHGDSSVRSGDDRNARRIVNVQEL